MATSYQKAEKFSHPRFGVVEVGSVYCRTQDTNVVDTAEVLALMDDSVCRTSAF